MLGNTYEKQNCSAARTLEIVGERWSLLILRDALFLNMCRFSDFENSLGLASNILTKRLESFVEAGLFELRPDELDTRTIRYLPTKKCRDLKPVIMALAAWGDRWTTSHRPPIFFRHADCGGRLSLSVHCAKCDVEAKPEEILAVPRRGVQRTRN